MNKLILIAMGAACLVRAAPAGRPVSLTEALRSAVSRAKADDARGEVAASQLRMLEAANKWKVELRPTLGLLSFSHPALLAANLGSSLLMGRRNAPSSYALTSARFDVLAAELASEQLRARTEIETARAFFDLLEKQQVSRQIQAVLAERRKKERELERLLQVSRVTAVDRINFQQDLLELEEQVVDAEMRRRLSSVQLAALMGQLDGAEELEVEDAVVTAVSLGSALPPVEKLVESALLYRKESQLLRNRIEALREKAGVGRKSPVESISTGYSYLANGVSALANTTRPDLIGGHSGQGGFTLSIPLRQTGEKAAEKELLLARIRALELESRVMETELRSELLSMRNVVEAGMQRLQLASRRVELTRKKRQMIQARADNGLGAFDAAARAEEADLQAEGALVKASCARKNSLFALMVLCGMEDQVAAAPPRLAGN